MPADPAELRRWRETLVQVQVGEQWLVLEGPLPAALRPVTWVVAPEEAQALIALRQSASQAGIATLPARFGDREACALHGTSRARAMKLAYKRKQALILGLFPDRVEVVYTGLGSRR